MLHAERARLFQERARAGKVCLGIHSGAMSPQLIEMYGIVELDFVIIGQEVEALDLSKLEDLLRAANAGGTVPIVKLKRPDPNLVGEIMNLGAPMVMVPHVTNRKILETMVRASRFAPEGLRGECPIARYNGFGARDLKTTYDAANSSHSVIPIIEDKEALDHLDDMMEVEGVDLFEIGPFDLSLSLGENGRAYNGPKTMAAIEQICEAAQRHGKGVVAPVWHTIKDDSYPAVYKRQMDELISRGINCLYEIDSAFMAVHLTRMNILRNVRTVDEAEVVAPAPVAAKTNGKSAAAKGANGTNGPSPTNGTNGTNGHAKSAKPKAKAKAPAPAKKSSGKTARA